MKRTSRVYAHVTPKEKQEVVTSARQAHLTVSEFVRRLISGRQLPNLASHEAVIEMGRINADLARLGNLLRMALDDPDFTPPKSAPGGQSIDLETLFEAIRTTQMVLKNKVKEL